MNQKIVAALTAVCLIASTVIVAAGGTILLSIGTTKIVAPAPTIHVDPDNSIESKKRHLAAFGSLVPLAKTAFSHITLIQSALSFEELRIEALGATASFQELADAASEIPVPSDWEAHHTRGLISLLEFRAAFYALSRGGLFNTIAGIWQIHRSVNRYEKNNAEFYALLRKSGLLEFYQQQLGYMVQ